MAVPSINWAYHFATIARRFASRTAISDAAGSIGYAELFDRAAGIAARLIEAGAAPGDPVATCFPNGRFAAAASYACMMAGAAEMPLNIAYTDAERRDTLDTVPARVAIVDAARAGFFRDAGLSVVVADEVGPATFEPNRFAPVSGATAGRIVFTSGTTGRPKAVVYSHRARFLGNLLLQASLPFLPGRNSRVLLMTPFAHGTSLQTFAWLDQGGEAVLMDGAKLDQVEPMLAAGSLEAVFAAPTVLAKFANDFAGRRFEGVRAIFTGTAPLAPAVYRRAREMFGPVVRVTYGKSEVFNPITVLPPDATDAYYEAGGGNDGRSCVGWPAQGVELAIGEDGEVLIRAQHMSDGFIDAAGFHPWREDGFHPTGDVGEIDELGRLHLKARLSDAIKSGGYKIYPQEIERALAPAIGANESVVLGLPSEYWGEIVVAVAERPPEGWEALARQSCGDLAAFKRPRFFLELAVLPRNAQGKVVRRRVIDEIRARHRLVDGPRPSLEPIG